MVNYQQGTWLSPGDFMVSATWDTMGPLFYLSTALLLEYLNKHFRFIHFGYNSYKKNVHLTTCHKTFSLLQSVDPSVTSPYWDFIEDSTLDSPGASAIWTNDFYGSMIGDPEHGYAGEVYWNHFSARIH